MSLRTLRSSFSFRLSAHDVCWMHSVNSPILYLESGRDLVISSVIRYEPWDLEGRMMVFWNQVDIVVRVYRGGLRGIVGVI